MPQQKKKGSNEEKKKIIADSNCNSQVPSLSFSLMCQSLLRHSCHTSTSSPISFICLFHPLIFTSVSFTITPLLRGALTSVVHSPHPKAMVRVRGERDGQTEELSDSEKVGGWGGVRRVRTSHTQPVTHQSTPELCCAYASLTESLLLSNTPTGPVISQTVDSKK